MKRKKTVAVIDSGVDNSDLLLENAGIKDFYYEEGILKQQYTGIVNMHGTEIIKVLLRECPDVNIISIRTLQDNNKCMLSDIINAMKHCIELGVDVVNLSLGSCTATAKRIDKLKEVCEMAVEKGIVIFAADHNIPDRKSYPANFDCVLGVTTTDDLDGICHIHYKDRIVEFADNHVYIPDSSRCIVRRGNSYLCPLLAGLFCSYVGGQEIIEKTVPEFMDFLQVISEHQKASKIFFDKTTEPQINMSGKRMYFFADDMDLNNMRLYNMYREACNVELCFNRIYNCSVEEMESYLKTTDIFYFGALSNEFLLENQNFLEKLIDILEKNCIFTITVFPIIGTYRRICLTGKSRFKMKSIYK